MVLNSLESCSRDRTGALKTARGLDVYFQGRDAPPCGGAKRVSVTVKDYSCARTAPFGYRVLLMLT